ncbi:hypothetical protein FBR04_19090 [Betaproteobacteria bacterium PRO7]|jgi:hypothetical protein|nr:hypothetical protein [Betaproteobacteria bacterium PRO7]
MAAGEWGKRRSAAHFGNFIVLAAGKEMVLVTFFVRTMPGFGRRSLTGALRDRVKRLLLAERRHETV